MEIGARRAPGNWELGGFGLGCVAALFPRRSSRHPLPVGETAADASHTIEFEETDAPPAVSPWWLRTLVAAHTPGAEQSPGVTPHPGASDGFVGIGIYRRDVAVERCTFPHRTHGTRETWGTTVSANRTLNTPSSGPRETVVVGKLDYSLVPSVSFARPGRACAYGSESLNKDPC
eukprot:gene17476-biopygen5341